MIKSPACNVKKPQGEMIFWILWRRVGVEILRELNGETDLGLQEPLKDFKQSSYMIGLHLIKINQGLAWGINQSKSKLELGRKKTTKDKALG